MIIPDHHSGGDTLSVFSSSRAVSFIDTLIDLPLVLPPAVAGVALLIAFGRRGILGGVLGDLGIHIALTLSVILILLSLLALLIAKNILNRDWMSG